MSGVAIRVEGLSKQYRIGAQEGYRTLRESITDVFTAPFRRLRSGASSNGHSETIWALKDVSFEVKHGEVIGIIGRNGAGKSTLLKILSRITEPTEGHAEIHGRVGSLLEVGTGFHPELTGRENIFLNGAILGMKKAEILRKFDEIVAFAEVEKFVDTPVKHYSSGMYVRLAFAVAAHLEPEILIVDEVLAVGDAAFQKKCLGRMDMAAKAGRAIVFVSHQLNQIRRLCGKVIWLDAGGIHSCGQTGLVTAAYDAALLAPRENADDSRDSRIRGARFVEWRILHERGEHSNVLRHPDRVTVEFVLDVRDPIRDGSHGLALFNVDRQLMWASSCGRLCLDPGVHRLRCEIGGLPLRPGPYQWQASIYGEEGLLDLWECSPPIIVDTKPLTHTHDQWQGILNVDCRFEQVPAQQSIPSTVA